MIINDKILRTNGLNNHGVDFVWAELELVSRKGVGETEGHGVHILLAQAGDERGNLATNATHQFGHGTVVHASDIQFLLNGVTNLKGEKKTQKTKQKKNPRVVSGEQHKHRIGQRQYIYIYI